MEFYKNKYLKYKNKYFELRKKNIKNENNSTNLIPIKAIGFFNQSEIR